MIQGVDVSHWQGEMDWQKAKVAGARFAFIRAGAMGSDGFAYEDKQFKRNRDKCHLPRGFYWFFRPNFDANKQADYFSDLILTEQWDLPPVLDIETHGGATPDVVISRTKQFLDRAKNQIGIDCMIYTRASFWNYYLGNPSWAKRHELWIARYAPLSGPWSDGYWKPSSWDTWRFWQHSADGNGLGGLYGADSKSIDLNYFNGGEAEFAAYIGDSAPEPVVASVEVPKEVNRIEIRLV